VSHTLDVRELKPSGVDSARPLQPWDEYNRKLYGNVHPPEWINPEPAPRYNLVVIGGGTAGLVTAAGAVDWARGSHSWRNTFSVAIA
jgi:hypothetical protein